MRDDQTKHGGNKSPLFPEFVDFRFSINAISFELVAVSVPA